MTVGYTKLFSEIVMSTVWREPNHVRIVWITMLALKDRWHVVSASLPGLADAARVTMDECDDALLRLSSPDSHSRTKEFEGRRIEPCDSGWIILNGEKYRNKMSLDERREYQRIKQKEYRDRVKSCIQTSQLFTHTDTDTEADTESLKTTTTLPRGLSQKTWDDFKDHRKALKAKLTPNAEKRLLAKLEKMVDQEDIEAAVSNSIENGWRGIFPSKSLFKKTEPKPGKMQRAAEALRRVYGDADSATTSNDTTGAITHASPPARLRTDR